MSPGYANWQHSRRPPATAFLLLHPPPIPRGGERRSLLATTLTANSLTLTSGNNRPDNSTETSLEMLPKNEKFWHRNHSYQRPLCTYNPVSLLLLSNLLCSASLFKQLISRLQIMSTNVLMWCNFTNSPRRHVCNCRLTTNIHTRLHDIWSSALEEHFSTVDDNTKASQVLLPTRFGLCSTIIREL